MSSRLHSMCPLSNSSTFVTMKVSPELFVNMESIWVSAFEWNVKAVRSKELNLA
ncbi:hypothetical protein L3Y34_013504 [Caenorhabditis briggsae]|uniref:Uncharacterized protein n=1 Tax=Caenorhabditis briggsae TaxID=6238 RepID=A0AAE8ZV34_CAEBR|nr:hypothetical protein L3Y34_013504 [Caenorhabditis briggsae]